jgi:hypothetical protein
LSHWPQIGKARLSAVDHLKIYRLLRLATEAHPILKRSFGPALE